MQKSNPRNSMARFLNWHQNLRHSRQELQARSYTTNGRRKGEGVNRIFEHCNRREEKESYDCAISEKEVTSQQLASYTNSIAELTDQHSGASELLSATEAHIIKVFDNLLAI
ncbi:hypothetical protein QYF36_020142 [Acer negundo]|nr:hypothetical protein QYF36_020142 [Acer negundo]